MLRPTSRQGGVVGRLRDILSGKSRSLRTHLLLIVVAAFLPLLIFSAVAVSLFAGKERSTFRAGAMDRSRALLTAVETEIKRSQAVLEALAISADLDGEKLEDFRQQAERVLRTRPEWYNIHLTPPTGQQIMNLLRPPDSPFHRVIDATSFEECVRKRAPTVGNLLQEPFKHERTFPVRVPVIRDGEVRYVLTALVYPRVIHDLLAPLQLPANGIGVVLDASGHVVARTVNEGEMIGKPAADSLRAALTRSDSGWFTGHTIEGWPVYTTFERSDEMQWTVAVGIPRSAIEAPLRRSLSVFGAFALLLLGLGLGVAWWLSRRTSRSLEELSSQAEDLGLGRENPVQLHGGPTGISEVDELMRAFARADDLIRTRSEERDRYVHSLRSAEGELRDAEQRKDHFLAMLGHELRNPLGVIATAVHLMRHLPPDAADEPRSMIERQVAHMSKLIDDLLDVSRIAEGRIQMKRELCDLTAIVRSTAEDYRRTLEGGGLQLVLTLPEAPLWVNGDPTRLAQALDNLLQNAFKYTDSGGRVCVSVTESAGGESATVSVRDTGVGMEPEILEHAFEPFSQADRTIARSRGGLGLGLPLVKGLIEAHRGTVRAVSGGSGLGTEILVTLPLEPALSASRELPHDLAPERPARMQRVLVIEDNEMAARSMQLYLTAMGHEVEVAHNGPDGISAARRHAPEVVVCDIGLPGADGYEVARALRSEPASSYFLIALSGYGQTEDVRKAREAGFDEHLTKPVDLDEFRRILENAPASGGSSLA